MLSILNSIKGVWHTQYSATAADIITRALWLWGTIAICVEVGAAIHPWDPSI